MTYPVQNLVTADYPDGIQTFDPSLTAAQKFTSSQISDVQALVSDAVTAPATIDSTNITKYNGARVRLAAGATLTIDGSAWDRMGAGLLISIERTGTATLAFSGSALKSNSAGTSGSSVTLAAAGEYALQQGFTSLQFRLSGGAAI